MQVVLGPTMRRVLSCVVLILAAGIADLPVAGQSPVTSARPSTTRPTRAAGPPLAMTAQSLVNIYGRAIDALKDGVPGAHVRLRNARTGRIAGDTTTDKYGDFEFLSVNPGMYVPEMISQSGRLIAAGEMLVVEYGETIATIVRLPVKLSLYNLMRDSGAMTDALEQNAVAVAAATAQTGATAAATGAPAAPVTNGIFAPTIGTIVNVAISAGILTRVPEGPAASARQ